MALCPPPFHDGGQHDDERRLAFPNHVPKVGTCGRQGTLGRNVSAKTHIEDLKCFTNNILNRMIHQYAFGSPR